MKHIKQSTADKFFGLLKQCEVYARNEGKVYHFEIHKGTKILYSKCGIHQRDIGKWRWEIDSPYEIGSCEKFTTIYNYLKKNNKLYYLDGELILP